MQRFLKLFGLREGPPKKSFAKSVNPPTHPGVFVTFRNTKGEIRVKKAIFGVKTTNRRYRVLIAICKTESNHWHVMLSWAIYKIPQHQRLLVALCLSLHWEMRRHDCMDPPGVPQNDIWGWKCSKSLPRREIRLVSDRVLGYAFQEQIHIHTYLDSSTLIMLTLKYLDLLTYLIFVLVFKI